MEPPPRTDTLESLTRRGRKLLTNCSGDVLDAHRDFNSWMEDVAEWLDAEARGMGLSAEWSGLPQSYVLVGNSYDDSPGAWAKQQRAIQARLTWLASVPIRISAAALRKLASSPAPSPRSISKPSKAANSRVFLVHGRNDLAREETARFIERLGFECVILHEQANSGRTIIEKFEHFSNVAFAVVLLTADDIGGLLEGLDQKPRARQNVILELGFFLGALGRKNVCPIYAEGVELPSDYSGVVFVPLDKTGAWRMALAREMKAAGLDVDLNKAIY